MWKEHCAETGEALSASGGSGAGLGETDASIRSTQMKILHKNGFTADERRECAGTIRKNTITSIQQLIIGCQELQYMFEKNFEKDIEKERKNESMFKKLKELKTFLKNILIGYL